MTRLMEKFSISNRMVVSSGIPIVGLLLLSLLVFSSSYRTYSETKSFREIVSAIEELGVLAQLLQEEMGLGAMHIGSNDETVSAELTAARTLVDEEYKHFHDIASRFKIAGNAKVSEGLSIIETDLESLADFRQKVDAREADVSANDQFFSTIFSDIHKVEFEASKVATQGDVVLNIVAIMELAEAKSYSAREKALIAAALGTKLLTSEQYLSFNEYIARQDLLVENFILGQPEAIHAELEERIGKAGSASVDTLRGKIRGVNGNLVFAGIEAANWYEKASQRVNAMYEVEKEVTKELTQIVDGLISEEFNSMVLSATATALLLIITIGAGALVARSITQPLANLSKSMEDISNGNLEAHIHGTKLADEIGNMSRALAGFRDGMSDKQRMEMEALQERETRELERYQQEEAKAKEAEAIKFAVDALGDALQKLASGDLSVSIDTQFKQGLDDLRMNFNAAVAELAKTLGTVKQAIGGIDNTANEMRTATTDLSTRTEQQAHSLQEVATALEQVTGAVQSSAQDASNASTMAVSVREGTADSLRIVEEAVKAMGRIEDASNQISSIINVIDEITFQTNLLALNAGVEAARAGEAGKGFAVVAQEVRELAHRSAASAKEIKQLIGASSKEVEGAVSRVQETGEALNVISNQVQEISQSIEAIAAATQQQSGSLGECSGTISSLDRSTQQNAAMVEESTAVMQSLANDSKQLAATVSRFVLEKGANGQVSRAA